MTKRLTQHQRDEIRAAAMRLAMSAFDTITKRVGVTPDILALIVEGFFAAVVTVAWRDRHDDLTKTKLTKILRGLLQDSIRDVVNVSKGN